MKLCLQTSFNYTSKHLIISNIVLKKKILHPEKISFKGLKIMFDIKIDPYFIKIFF